NAKERTNRLMPGGVPKWVRIYDNGETADRFTCLFTGRRGTVRYDRAPWGRCRAMSADPYHPQGVALWSEIRGGHNDANKWGFAPAIGRKCHLGTRIRFEDLP